MGLKKKQKNKKRSHSGGLDRNTRKMVMLADNQVWQAFAKKPVAQKTQTTLALASRKALYALANGDGELEQVNELIVSAYAGIILAEQGYGEDQLSVFHSALKTLIECRDRTDVGGVYCITEEEGHLVGDLLALHEQQVQLAGKAELAAALVDGYSRAKEMVHPTIPEEPIEAMK